MPKPAEMTTTQLPVACFAPDLIDELLVSYRALADALPDSLGEVRDAMRECLAACEAWWELPVSTTRPQHWRIKHDGRDVEFALVPLTDELKEQLWDAVPWPYELDSMQALFDRTFADRSAFPKELVDACYHLLWHARELCLDREPLTQAVLPDPAQPPALAAAEGRR